MRRADRETNILALYDLVKDIFFLVRLVDNLLKPIREPLPLGELRVELGRAFCWTGALGLLRFSLLGGIRFILAFAPPHLEQR